MAAHSAWSRSPQFSNDQHVMIIRNGWFSYRWSEILEKGKIASSTTVMVALRTDTGGIKQMAPFTPVPVDKVVATICDEKLTVVLCRMLKHRRV